MKSDQASEVYRRLSAIYPTFEESDDPWVQNGLSSTPFKSIVSVALSTMTTTSRVIKAANALYLQVNSFEELADLDDDTLREAIGPVAHYNRKTGTLKKMARQILDEHDGQIPRTRDELMALSGIGRKCTDLLMNAMNEDDTSVAVDTHVHRLVNRLGLVETTTAEATADQLEQITPQAFRKHAHEWLIQHGGTVCTARRPHCEDCVLADLCPSTALSAPRVSTAA